MIVVSDTSSITTLLQIGMADLLKRLYGEVLIPEAVRKELFQFHLDLPGFIQFRQVENKQEVERLSKDVDPGEAEAIILAKELNADLLLIDELEGRAVAGREGVPFIGLMGVLLEAKEDGYIFSIRNVIEELETKTTFRLSEAMKTRTLQAANEL